MKYPMITAAVVAALGGMNAAHALNITDTVERPRAARVPPAPPLRATRSSPELNASVCQAGTLTVYRATPTALQDFRAYSCTITTGGTAGRVCSAPPPARTRRSTTARKVVGLGPEVRSRPTPRSRASWSTAAASPNSTLTTPSGAVPLFELRGQRLHALERQRDVGSDPSVHAARRVGRRAQHVHGRQLSWCCVEPLPGVRRARCARQLNGLPRTVGFAQVFGVLLGNNGAASAITSLTPAEVSAIYSGQITDWSSTINPTTGAENPSRPDHGRAS